MEIKTRNVGKCKILDCKGPITLGPDTAALRKAIRAAALDEPLKMVLNLGDVPYVDSSGIGELISGFVHVKNKGGRLVLLNLTKKINELLFIAKLLTVFDVYDDEKKALEGCK